MVKPQPTPPPRRAGRAHLAPLPAGSGERSAEELPRAFTIAADYRLRSAAIIALAGLVYALVARFALRAFPYSGDEYSYLLQAEAFARGVFKASAPSYGNWVGVDHVVIDSFVRSKYPPGTAALLAVAVKAQLAWLATPLEGVLALIFTWLGARLILDERRAFLTIAFLAASPLFAYQAATFSSHTASVLWLSLAVLALAWWARSRRVWGLIGFGAAVGCLFLTRPLDGLLVGLALVVVGDPSAVLIAGVSALPFVGLDLWYNQLQFGSPFTDGYAAYAPALAAIYGGEGAVSQINPLNLVAPQQVWNHLAIIETLFAQWTVPGLGLFACLGWTALRRQRVPGTNSLMLRYLGGLVAAFLVALLITMTDPDDCPRPRYLSPVLLPLSLFAAVGYPSAARFVREQLGRPASWVVGAAVWLAPLFLIGSYLEHRVPELVVRSGLSEEIARQTLDAGVVVVRAEWPTLYARNGAFFDRPPILLSVPSSVTLADVAGRFPNQPIYEAIEPHGSNPWKHPWAITRVR